MSDAKRLAALEADAEALRRGIEGYLDGTWRQGWRPSRGKCMHGQTIDEPCEECVRAYFRAVLGGLHFGEQA